MTFDFNWFLLLIRAYPRNRDFENKQDLQGLNFSQLRSIRAVLRLSNFPGFNFLSLMPDFAGFRACGGLTAVSSFSFDRRAGRPKGSGRLGLSFEALLSEFSSDPGEVVGEHAPAHCEPTVF